MARSISKLFQDPGADARFSRVALSTVGAITLLMIVMVARVAQLQIAPSPLLQTQMKPRITAMQDPAMRGDIVDRRGRLLATTRIARRVVLDPTIFAAQEQSQKAIERLAKAMGVPVSVVQQRLDWAIAENARRAELAKNWPLHATVLEAVVPDAMVPLALTQTETKAPSPGIDENDPFALANHATTAVPSESGPVVAETTSSSTMAGGAITQPASQPTSKGPPKPLRYLPIGGILTDEQTDAVRWQLSRKHSQPGARALQGVVLERVPERRLVAGDEAAAIVGMVGFGDTGLAGTEYRLEKSLTGTAGKIAYWRDRSGRPLWIEPGFIVPATNGTTARLSIDLELQRIAHEELGAQVERMDAAGGRLILMDPSTGEVLAMVDIVRSVADAKPIAWVPAASAAAEKGASKVEIDQEIRYRVIEPDPLREIHPALAKNRCVVDVYEPGSTFKPFVWSVITELGRAKVTETIDTENGRWTAPDRRYIEDVTKRKTMLWPEVLVNSSNIGMVKVGQRLSYLEMHDLVKRFGFGSRTNIGLPGESAGIVTPMSRWKLFTQVSVAYGHEVAVTPLQMVRAFSAFARTGDFAGTLPTLRLTARDSDEAAPITYRVLPPSVAKFTRETMQGVVDVVDARWAKDSTPEGGWRYDLFGKSGTAKIPVSTPPKGMVAPKGLKGYFDNQFISSFIAGGPVENPRLVCLVVIDDPGKAEGRARAARYGSAAAGPVARKVMERSLTYLGVPASRQPTPQLAEAPLHDQRAAR
jgi:cell division protein FtsI/penicillin-binding protein 2